MRSRQRRRPRRTKKTWIQRRTSISVSAPTKGNQVMSLLATAAFILVTAKPQPYRMLFIGNSHTDHNDIASLVTRLLESDGSERKVESYHVFFPFLNDAYDNEGVRQAVIDPKWDVI